MIAANRPCGRTEGGRFRVGGILTAAEAEVITSDYHVLIAGRCPARSIQRKQQRLSGSFIKPWRQWCSTRPRLTVTPSDRFPSLLLGDVRNGSKGIKELNPRLNRTALLGNVATSTWGSAEHLRPSLQTRHCSPEAWREVNGGALKEKVFNER